MTTPRTLAPLRTATALIVALGLLVLLPFVAAPARPVDAHPLGNFTVNRYARVQLSADGVVVRYVLDMAEIPAFQEIQSIDKDRDGSVNESEARAYAAPKANELRDGLFLDLNGSRVALALLEETLTFPEGQAGLKTLRLVVDYRGALPQGWENGLEASLRDRNYDDRLGWKEIVVTGGPGVDLTVTSVPQTDRTAELTAYPATGLQSPLDVREARFAFMAGDGTAVPAVTAPLPGKTTSSPPKSANGFAKLIATENLTPAFVALSLLAAMAWGAAHALGPGHGKTIVAAYLVGSRGTARHAVILGLTVTVTHTFVVVLLGLVTLFASRYVPTEDLYLWLSVSSGVMVVGVGAYLFLSRLRGLTGVLGRRSPAPAAVAAVAQEAVAGTADKPRWQPPAHMRTRLGIAPVAAHSHYSIDHGHEADGAHFHAALGQDHGQGHSHLPMQPGLRGLIALGISGGLLPCPTALVVMLAAIALDRITYGLVLIFAFSFGLAAVLTGIGVLLVYANRVLNDAGSVAGILARIPFSTRALQVAPIGSAAVILMAGIVLTGNAIASL